MARMVQCIKLGREAEGLDFPPYPGELGKRIYENVSTKPTPRPIVSMSLRLAIPRRVGRHQSRLRFTNRGPFWRRRGLF